MSFLRYIRQDGIWEWWKESLSAIDGWEEQMHWRRIWWLLRVVEKQGCGCGSDTENPARDWICDRCWVLARGRRALGGKYFRDGDDSYGYSHGRPMHNPIPARPTP